MKLRIVITVFVLAICRIASAQQNDSIRHDAKLITISIDALTQLQNEKEKAQKDLDNLKKAFDKLSNEFQQNKGKLISLDTKLNRINEQNRKMTHHINKTDTCLIDMASNFLYIPYEAYSVEKIAIPAFESIYSQELKNKRVEKYNLLKNYQNNIRKLSEFLKYAQEETAVLFTKDGKEILDKLKDEDFYKNYIQYSDYKATYIGKFIVKITTELNSFNRPNILSDFATIQKELDDSIETIKDL